MDIPYSVVPTGTPRAHQGTPLVPSDPPQYHPYLSRKKRMTIVVSTVLSLVSFIFAAFSDNHHSLQFKYTIVLGTAGTVCALFPLLDSFCQYGCRTPKMIANDIHTGRSTSRTHSHQQAARRLNAYLKTVQRDPRGSLLSEFLSAHDLVIGANYMHIKSRLPSLLFLGLEGGHWTFADIPWDVITVDRSIKKGLKRLEARITRNPEHPRFEERMSLYDRFQKQLIAKRISISDPSSGRFFNQLKDAVAFTAREGAAADLYRILTTRIRDLRDSYSPKELIHAVKLTLTPHRIIKVLAGCIEMDPARKFNRTGSEPESQWTIQKIAEAIRSNPDLMLALLSMVDQEANLSIYIQALGKLAIQPLKETIEVKLQSKEDIFSFLKAHHPLYLRVAFSSPRELIKRFWPHLGTRGLDIFEELSVFDPDGIYSRRDWYPESIGLAIGQYLEPSRDLLDRIQRARSLEIEDGAEEMKGCEESPLSEMLKIFARHLTSPSSPFDLLQWIKRYFKDLPAAGICNQLLDHEVPGWTSYTHNPSLEEDDRASI